MEEDKKDDEITLDFSKIKNIFKKKKTDSEQLTEKTKEDDSIDFKNLFVTYKKYLVPLLILIPILLSIFFRAQPFSLPVTDDWAERSIIENMKANIAGQVDKQYPSLPDENKQRLIEENVNKYIRDNKKEFNEQTAILSNNYKARMRDENGQTYLLAIDPYLWYGEAQNYVETGQFGNGYKEDLDWNYLRNGREGVEAGKPFNSVMTVLVYKIVHMFNKDYTVMGAAFLIPLLIMTLAVFPVFFIGQKFGGNIGGFFAATLFAIHPSILSRTVAGFSDTDPYTIFFPLLAIWFFFEALDAKTQKNKYLMMSLSGLSLAMLSLAWGQGWWYTFDFILATMGLYLVYILFTDFKKIKNNFSGFIKGKQVKEFFFVTLSLTAAFIVFRGFISLFSRSENLSIGFRQVFDALIAQPLWFIKIKEVAGVTLWPNVLTTVAELNPASFQQIMGSLGGFLLFFVSIIGILLIILKSRESEKKQYVKFALLIAIWFSASLYAALISQRFIALIVPVFALAFGAGLGIGYDYIRKSAAKGLQLNEKLLSIVMILVFLTLLISPVKTAWGTTKSEVPSFTDAWYDSLSAIRDASDDAVITSWWDFGHWFVAMGQRRVTFDGGNQGNRIHWVGKSLLTDNEKESVAILRMLNCGQEKAYDTLENYTNDSYGSKILLDELILLEKEDADRLLEEAGFDNDERKEILDLTHCEDIIDQYYITSGDMVGKAGVWAHFGSWDFEKAKIYNSVSEKSSYKAREILTENFGYSEKEADKLYYEIKSTPADHWITTWPSYVSQLSPCLNQDDIIICQNGLIVNITDYDAYMQIQGGPQNIHSLVYAGDDDLVEIKYNKTEKTLPYSAAIIGRDNNYQSIIMDPLLAKSTFTRLFFFDGLGSKYFKLLSDQRTFTGLRIQVWDVSFEEMDKLIPARFEKEETEEEELETQIQEEELTEDEVSNISIEEN